MREPTDRAGADGLTERVRATPGLGSLLAEAESVWRARGDLASGGDGERPGWRPFEDAFPTFYQFTNRPPR